MSLISQRFVFCFVSMFSSVAPFSVASLCALFLTQPLRLHPGSAGIAKSAFCLRTQASQVFQFQMGYYGSSGAGLLPSSPPVQGWIQNFIKGVGDQSQGRWKADTKILEN